MPGSDCIESRLDMEGAWRGWRFVPEWMMDQKIWAQVQARSRERVTTGLGAPSWGTSIQVSPHLIIRRNLFRKLLPQPPSCRQDGQGSGRWSHLTKGTQQTCSLTFLCCDDITAFLS